MAKKNNNTLLWVALLGGAGFLWYKSSATTTTTTATPGVADTAGGPEDLHPIALPVNSAPIYSSPTQTISVATASVLPAAVPQTITADVLPAGISQLVYNTVMTWAYADGRAPIKAMANALVPAEYAGMYDIITNQWGKNQPATAAQRTFWDNLRKKYDPQHLLW